MATDGSDPAIPPPVPPPVVPPSVVQIVQPQPTRAVSPYELNASDHPGSVVTQVQFKGDNYDEWSRAIRGAFRARRKFGFLDGSIVQPTDPNQLDDWWVVNSLLVTWINNTIDKDLRSQFTLPDVAKEFWDALKQRFSVINAPKLQQIKSAIANCKQNGESVANYYGRLKKLWDELRDHDQTPSCTCNGCSCDLKPKLDQKREEEQIHQFLMGLDEPTFKSVRSAVLHRDPLPPLNRVYHMIVQEESLAAVSSTPDTTAPHMAFLAAGPKIPSSNRRVPKTSLTCTFCKKTGHDVTTCFEIYGFPDWWEDRSKRPVRGASQPAGGASKNRATTAKANAVAAGEPSLSSTVEQPPPGVTSDEWAILLSLRASKNILPSDRLSGKDFSHCWIVDTGASRHMTGNHLLLQNHRVIAPYPV